jgi:hypothetical protein
MLNNSEQGTMSIDRFGLGLQYTQNSPGGKTPTCLTSSTHFERNKLAFLVVEFQVLRTHLLDTVGDFHGKLMASRPIVWSLTISPLVAGCVHTPAVSTQIPGLDYDSQDKKTVKNGAKTAVNVNVWRGRWQGGSHK